MDNLPVDIENLIYDFTGDSHFVISESEFENLYKVEIPLNDKAFLINDGHNYISEKKCENCKNLTAEYLFYQNIIRKCEKYEKIYGNNNKIIFNYELNQDIEFFNFFVENYHNFLKMDNGRYKMIKPKCKCFGCKKVSHQINRIRLYRKYSDIEKLFKRLDKSKKYLLKSLKLRDKSHMFKTLTLDTVLI